MVLRAMALNLGCPTGTMPSDALPGLFAGDQW